MQREEAERSRRSQQRASRRIGTRRARAQRGYPTSYLIRRKSSYMGRSRKIVSTSGPVISSEETSVADEVASREESIAKKESRA